MSSGFNDRFKRFFSEYFFFRKEKIEIGIDLWYAAWQITVYANHSRVFEKYLVTY